MTKDEFIDILKEAIIGLELLEDLEPTKSTYYKSLIKSRYNLIDSIENLSDKAYMNFREYLLII